MFGAINRRHGHRATRRWQVDVFGALSPGCTCAASQGICYQRAVFVVNIAHTRFLGGSGAWAPQALKKSGEGGQDAWGGGFWGIGDCVQRRGFEDALGLAVVGVFGDAVVFGGAAAPAQAGGG